MKEYIIPVYRVLCNPTIYMSWIDVSVDEHHFFSLSQLLLNSIHFNECIILDTYIPTMGFSSPALAQISNFAAYPTIPRLPSPNYITGLGASLYASVILCDCSL